MPTYDYRCPNCDKFSVYQGIREPALKVCPTCSSPVSRLIGKNVNIIFKCQGFYSTDTRSPSGTAGKEEEKTVSDNKTENKTDNKTEISPEKKADNKTEKTSGQKAVNE